MNTEKELKLLYQGDVKRIGREAEYIFCFAEALLPIIKSWEVDEWGDAIIEVKSEVKVSGKEFIDMVQSLVREQAVIRKLDGTNKFKMTIY